MVNKAGLIVLATGFYLLTTGVVYAGASDDKQATAEELKNAGQNMVPAEDLVPSPVIPGTSAKSNGADKTPKTAATNATTAKPVPVMTPEPVMATPAAETKMSAEPEMQSEGSGFYFRVDTGLGFADHFDMSAAAGSGTTEEIENNYSLAVGAGYRFDDMFRTDLTLDYHPGMELSASAAGGGAATSEVAAFNALLNVYVDYQAFEGITPYVGAGVGSARLKTDNLVTTGLSTESGTTSHNLAYALMTGATVPVTEIAAIDFGYRYLNMGDAAQSGSFADGTSATASEFEDLSVHEFRAGLQIRF